MLIRMFSQDASSPAKPQEGDLYKVLHLHNHTFELRYGYYEACERENPDMDPMPLYPDFLQEPRFTEEGMPFVTKMQDVCLHFSGERSCFSECAECSFYSHGEDLIGICVCPQNHQERGGQNDGSR